MCERKEHVYINDATNFKRKQDFQQKMGKY